MSTVDNYFRQLGQQLRRLRAELEAYSVRPAHQVGDAALLAFGHDVADHAVATRVLARSRVPRTAAATTRAAFEAGQDMLLLATEGDAFDDAGSMVYVFELLEQESVRERGVAGAEALEADTSQRGTVLATEMVAQEVARLDREVPGLGASLERALERLTGRTRYRHWSGMSRKEIALAIAARHPDMGKSGLAADALYGKVSTMAHPRLRTTDRRFHRTGTTIKMGPERDVRPFVLRLALISVILARRALEHAMQPPRDIDEDSRA
jgi:hypothetical protein